MKKKTVSDAIRQQRVERVKLNPKYLPLLSGHWQCSIDVDRYIRDFQRTLMSEVTNSGFIDEALPTPKAPPKTLQ